MKRGAEHSLWEAYSEPCQISKMEHLAKMVNNFFYNQRQAEIGKKSIKS